MDGRDSHLYIIGKWNHRCPSAAWIASLGTFGPQSHSGWARLGWSQGFASDGKLLIIGKERPYQLVLPNTFIAEEVWATSLIVAVGTLNEVVTALIPSALMAKIEAEVRRLPTVGPLRSLRWTCGLARRVLFRWGSLRGMERVARWNDNQPLWFLFG